MPVSIAIMYKEGDKRIPTPAGYPNQVTVEADEWAQVTDQMVERAVSLNLAYKSVRPTEPIEFAYTLI